MKSRLKSISKSTLSIVLTLCMLMSCLTVGIISTDAAKVGDNSVGADSDYRIYFNTNNNDPNSFRDANVDVTVSGSTFTATFPASFFNELNTNYYIALCYKNNSDIFFKGGSNISVTDDSSSCFSETSRQGYGDNQFARVAFGSTPPGDVVLTVDSKARTYSFKVVVKTYKVTVSSGAGGSVKASTTSVASGKSGSVSVGPNGVSLVATPQTGYSFDKWTVSSGASVASASSSSTKLTATADNGTVTASFKKISTQTRTIYFDNTGYNFNPPYAYAWTNNTKYLGEWPGTAMDRVKGNIWSIEVSVDATYIVFSGNGSNQTANLTLENDKDYYRKNGGWSSYEEPSSDNHFTAELGSTITDEGNLYTNIDATFYDYYTDKECQDGWLQLTNKEANEDWEPYQTLNKSLAKYAENNTITYPLYFGIFSGRNDGYAGYDNSTNYNFVWRVNDSNGLQSFNNAVTGLTGKTLANGTIHHYSSSDTTNNNGTSMALFDEDWLTSRDSSDGYAYTDALATIVNSNFPVRKTTSATPVKIYLNTNNQYGYSGTTDTAEFYAHFWGGSEAVNVLMQKSGDYYYADIPAGSTQVLFVRQQAGVGDIVWEGDGRWYNQIGDLAVPTDSNVLFTLNSSSGGDWGYYSEAELINPVDYYEFDSTNAKDNVWFNNIGQSNMSLEYGSGTSNGVKDRTNNGYGFFPFDGSRKTQQALDYGFGMKLEIKFTLGEDGQINGADQKFDFSGDDDLWVYVDDKLVLDLGGAHARTTGSINFATKTVTANSTEPIASENRNGAITMNNTDTNKVHTMTIYYMERGMNESNLKFGFSFTPVGNEFLTDNQVSYENVNEGLLAAVKNAAKDDTFTITHKTSSDNSSNGPASGKTYAVVNDNDEDDVVADNVTNNNGQYTLGVNQTADFINEFDKEDWFDLIVESNGTGNKFNYDSVITRVTDTETGKHLTVTEPTDDAGYRFQFITTKPDPTELDATIIEAVIKNTLATKDVSITKELSVIDTASEFTFEVAINIDGIYKTYDKLAYTLDGEEKETGADGRITLKSGQVIVINGVPENAKVQVTEVATPPKYHYESATVTATKYTTGDDIVANIGEDITGGKQFTVSGDYDEYLLTIKNEPYKYKITYTYPSRFYGNQSYVVSGNITQTASLVPKQDSGIIDTEDPRYWLLSDAVVRRFTPHESTFMTGMTWGYDEAEYGYENNTYTATVTAEPDDSFKPTIVFILPYAHSDSFPYSPTAEEPAYNADAENVNVSVPYGETYHVKEGDAEVFVQAPAELSGAGTFSYWKIEAKNRNTNVWEEVARCYSKKFNYVAFDNYHVTPIYGGTGSLESDIMTTISLLGYSRNQWNEGNKGTRNTANNAMDTVYVDFNLSFQNKGELILPDSNTEVGVIIENCSELTSTPTGDYITDYSSYGNISSKNTKAEITEFIKGNLTLDGYKNATSMRNITQVQIKDNLSNKNRIEYYLGINASVNNVELDNKYSLYRAYSYMKSGDEVILSEPVFFQIYDYASKTA